MSVERIRFLATVSLAALAAGCGSSDNGTQSADAGHEEHAMPAQAAATPPAAAQPADARLARGKYLVETIAGCGNCHTPHNPDGSLNHSMEFAGAYVITDPGFVAYARNISPDMETGIGSWSEDDIVVALREGKRPDGKYLGPPMSFPWYRRMSDSDAYAIAAFIKAARPIRNEVPASTFNFPLEGYGPPVGSVPDVSRADPVKYGEYLAGPVGHCMDCHTTLVEGRNDMAQLGRGQNVFAMPWHLDWTAISANITSDPQVGLGSWTDAEIERAIREGVSRDGRKLLPMMPFELYRNIAPEDMSALIAYLRSLPPLGL